MTAQCRHGWVTVRHDPHGHYVHVCGLGTGHDGLHECGTPGCGEIRK